MQHQWEHVFETPLYPHPSPAEIEGMMVEEMPSDHVIVPDAEFYGDNAMPKRRVAKKGGTTPGTEAGHCGCSHSRRRDETLFRCALVASIALVESR